MQAINDQGSKQAKIEAYKRKHAEEQRKAIEESTTNVTPSISAPVEPNEASGSKTVRIKPVENKNEDEDEDPDPNPGDPSNEPPKDKQSKKKSSSRKKKKNYSSGSSSDGSDSGGSNGPRPSKKSRGKCRRCHYTSDNDSDEYDRSIKMTPPVPYDSRNDLEYFDNWALSVTNYADVMKIHERTMMKMMSGYVSGQAQTFYNLNVFGRTRQWPYAKFFPALFNYCFPKNIMKQLRTKWDNLSQGKK
ncbi:hypothetical protein BDM02DRAFT_3194260 [Thelephora ganbajun]|uniref:Uncharacterized protein n=1 Tax=Thelephora ganbajun TaxID=370292 RepID=A0ACB6YX95_THEGA|nr:hypothetical protein BDM02DRAFT_3194260 [Thelephora ganbajun]